MAQQKIIYVRCSVSEWSLARYAAKLKDQSLNKYCIHEIVKASRETIDRAGTRTPESLNGFTASCAGCLRQISHNGQSWRHLAELTTCPAAVPIPRTILDPKSHQPLAVAKSQIATN